MNKPHRKINDIEQRQTTWWIIRRHGDKVQGKPLMLAWNEAICVEIDYIIDSHDPHKSKLPMQLYYEVFSTVMN